EVNLAGSYCLRNFAARKSSFRICGSVAVAHRATKYKRRNMRTPPERLFSKLNVAAPRHIAKKNSFRSAPRIVSGRESERWTELILRAFVMTVLRSKPVSRKQPGHEVDRGNGHPNAKENAGEDALRAALAEGEGQSGDDDGNEGQPARDGAGEGLLENIDGVLPGRATCCLGKDGCRQQQTKEQ